MAEEFSLRLSLELDESSLKSLKQRLNSGNFVDPIKVAAEIDDKSLKLLKNEIGDVGNFAKRTFSNLGNINLTHSVRQVDKLGSALKDMGFGDSAIKKMTGNIAEMGLAVDKVTTKLKKNGSVDITIQGIDEAGRLVKVMREMDSLGRIKVPKVDTILVSSSDAVKKVNAEFNEMISLIRQIDSKNGKLLSLDDESAEAKELASQISVLSDRAAELFGRLDGKISDEQLAKFNSTVEQGASNLALLKAKLQDVADANRLQEELKQTEADVNELVSTIRKIGSIETKLLSLDDESAEARQYKAELTELMQVQDRLLAKLEGRSISSDQFAKIGNAMQEAGNSASRLEAKLLDIRVATASGIIDQFNAGGFNRQSKEFESSLNKISNKTPEATTAVRAFNQAVDELDGAIVDGDANKIIGAYENVQRAAKEAKNQLKMNKIDDKDIIDAQKLERVKQSLESTIKVWVKDNSAAIPKFGACIDELIAKIKKADATDLDNLKHEFIELQKEAKLAGVATQSLGDKLKNKFKEYAAYATASMGIMEVVQGLRNMAQAVLEVDTAMTGLYRVTDLTANQYDGLYDNMIASSREYGQTLTDTINATSDWVRAGFDAETSLGLAEVTAMYQNVSDLDYDTAADNLLTSYNGFKEELMNAYGGDEVAAVEHVVDVLNELDNKFSVTSAGLGEGLSRSASALALAGNTYEESAAMIGAVTEVTQDPEKAGSAMKVLSLRLRGMKGQLQEMGEEVDENVESISKMQTQILNMTDGKVNIFDDNGDFRSTYDIMVDIAKVYYDLSSTDQADLLETIAGKHRANDVAALIQNIDNAIAMSETGVNAAGSAAEENARKVESLQGRLNALTATWQAFANTAMESGFLKGLVTAATGFLDVLTKIVDVAGTLPTLLGLAAGALSFKGIGITSIDKQTNSWKLFGKTVEEVFNILGAFKSGGLDGVFGAKFGESWSGFGAQVDKDIKCISNLEKALMNGVPAGEAFENCMKGASDSIREFAESPDFIGAFTEKNTDAMNAQNAILEENIQKRKQSQVAMMAENKSLSNVAQLIAEYNSGCDRMGKTCEKTGMTQAQLASAIGQSNNVLGKQLSGLNGAKASMTGYVASLIGAKAATIGLQIASMALNAVLTMGIGMAISALVTWIMDLAQAEEQLADKVDEATASYREQHDELAKNRSNFESLAQSYVKLSEGVEKFTGANKGLTTDEYEEYQSVVNQIADMIPSLVAGYDDQGNAILNCANNVGTLTDAYKDLIIAENNALLNGDDEDYNGISDISKDLKNSYDDLSTTGWWNDQLSIQGAEGLEELLKTAKITPDVVDDMFIHVEAVGKSLKRELEEQGLELEGMEMPKWYSSRDTWNEFIAEACKQHPEVAKKLVDSMNSEMDTATQEMRTAISAHMENAFLRGNYSNIDSEMQNIASTVVGGLDSSFIAELNQSGGEDAVLDYVDGILGAINSLSKKEMDVLKNSFDLSSQFESGELNYGEYKAQLENAVKSIEAMGFDEEVVSQLKLSLNVDEVNEQYDAILNRLTSEEFGIKMDAEKAENFLRGLSSTELAIAMDIIPELDAGATVEEIESAINREVLIQGLNLDFNIGEEIEWIEAFNTALEESASATGLTSESIAALTSRYKDLEGFDAGKLFGKTAQGVKLNTDAVNELEAALEEQNKTALNTHMEELQAEYERLTVAIQDADSASERADLYTQRDSIVDQINDTATLISQYEGLTSAFNDWINAQAGADKGDSYSQAKTMMEDAEELRDSGHVGTNEFKAAAQFVSSEDLSTADIETIVDAWVEGKKKFDKYFTDDESGSNAFLKDLEAMGEGWAEFNEETQEWTLDVDIDEAAERFGVSTSFIMTMLDELEARGIKVNYEDEGLEEFKTHAEEAQEAYNKIMGENGEKKLEFKFGSGDIDTVNSQLDEAKLLYDTITTADGKVNLDAEGAEEVRTMILSLIEEKQQLEAPAVMSVKVEGEAAKTEIGKATTLVQQLQQNLWSLEQSEYNPDINVGDVQSKISTIISSLNTLEQQDPEIYTKLGLESGQVDSLKTAIGNIQANIDAGVEPSPEDIATVQSTISGIDATVVANVLLGDTSGTTGSATITPEPSTTDLGDGFTGNATITPSPSTFNLGNDFTGNATITPSPSTTDLGSNFTGSGTINLTPNPTSLSVTVTGVSKADGTAYVNGTAFANGTVGRAFKQGDWSIKGSGVALGGELGQELVVRDGRYFTIGDNGAEFFNYKSGDIIFNAGQTKQLFEQGKITRGATRGRALASGTAFVGGSIPSSGRAFHIPTVDPDAEGGGKLYGGSTSNSSSSKKSSSKSSDAADEFEETLDWIEIAIDRIERAISRLDLTANSIYKKWSTRNEALADEIGKVNEEINLQQAAYNRYMQEAKSVGLSSSWAKKVQDGKVDIETITDEDLADKIKEYQEW